VYIIFTVSAEIWTLLDRNHLYMLKWVEFGLRILVNYGFPVNTSNVPMISVSLPLSYHSSSPCSWR